MRLVSYLLLLGLFTMGPTWAACSGADSDSMLNQVTLKLNTEQWVATKSALVSISINAGVNAKALASIQDETLAKLNKLNTGEWHIVSFDRTLDQSGLEKVQILAQARLPSGALSDLRDKAKAMSKPGETFTLSDIQFTPSEDELRAANIVLRNNIYQQAKEELAHLNKAYPDQKYYLHQINFIKDIQLGPMPQNAFIQKMQVGKDQGDGLAVSDKLIVSATVVLASAPEQCLTKMIH